MIALEPAPVARFGADCERLLGAPVGGRRLALAVSGGPDSMGMLALAAAAFPGRVTAATVDHALRAASADEAAMVAAHCATLGVPHATLAIAEPRPATGNLHAWARARRYALLLRWAAQAGCAALLTAHHADDQAETFLMRAARGSGVAGLAGIRARQPGAPPIIRPLLGWRRAELRAIAAAAAVPFVDDPSNRDPVFERARVRATLAAIDWLDPLRLAAAAAHAAEAEDALAALTEIFWAQRAAETPGAVAVTVAGLPREIRRRLAARALRAIDPATATDNIESLLESLESGKRATQGRVLAAPAREIWRFGPAPPRRSHQSA
ncbi:tRNA lysidine(34) synthetase TilS [Sphingomonas sp. NFR15]|uniref:tRNA lysidine(34) synthetase TilS n=1 Tax=Sphingomonas sp. NFR15 TaxID=1566282 RepID=UPI0008907ED2|nr:tRNA lysidine(34) synthetase TilS [Sphingomonas sp. NFR15]SDA24222.1 tRNA(Ile)-lysidine synthase [Sphingomonas sp. NFR15]